MIECVVNFSGGACSALAAKRAIERFGREKVVLIFADTGEEDPDLFRFMHQMAFALRANLVSLCGPLDMDQLIDREGAIPSPRMGFCTRELKRKVLDKWRSEHYPESLIVVGFDWTEPHRIKQLEAMLGADRVWCPMADRPLLTKGQMIQEIEAMGVRRPRLYLDGYQHNNCGGACVKAGQAAWAHLLANDPERYAKWEEREARISERRGKPCTILRDRRGGTTIPLPLSVFRERASKGLFDGLDWGGCGCFVEPEVA